MIQYQKVDKNYQELPQLPRIVYIPNEVFHVIEKDIVHSARPILCTIAIVGYNLVRNGDGF